MNEELVDRYQFRDIFPNYTTFKAKWDDSAFAVTTSQVSADNQKIVFASLFGRYANSTIASIDLERFEVQFFSILWQNVFAWQKKLAIQTSINGMSASDVEIRDTTVFNTAANPSTTPATSAFIALTKIDAQNAQQTKRNPLVGWAQLRELIEADFTNQFLDKFKKLFIVIVEGSEGLPPVLTIKGNHIYSDDFEPESGVYLEGDVKFIDSCIKQRINNEWVTVIDLSEIVGATAWGDITGTLSDQTDLQNALNGKVDKVTSTSTYAKVYVKNADGTQGMIDATGPDYTEGTIPIRRSSGRIYTGTPSGDHDAATKKYVDDAVATKSAVSGTNDGTNWLTITIDGVTYAIPAGGGGGGAAWGQITGTLADQIDLKNALDGKLDKDTSTSTSAKAYVKNDDGTQGTMELRSSAQANTLALRNANAQISVGTPTGAAHATTKKYVDDAVSGAIATTYYRHNILISTTANRVSFQIISTSSTAYTNATLVNYFGTNANAKISASGANYSNSRIKTAYQVSGDTATGMTIYVIFDDDGSVDTDEIDVLYAGLTVTDTVETIS